MCGRMVAVAIKRIWRSMGWEGGSASRIGIVSVAVLFLAGGLLLSRVDERKGKQEAGILAGG